MQPQHFNKRRQFEIALGPNSRNLQAAARPPSGAQDAVVTVRPHGTEQIDASLFFGTNRTLETGGQLPGSPLYRTFCKQRLIKEKLRAASLFRSFAGLDQEISVEAGKLS